jgi:hypothetical protein
LRWHASLLVASLLAGPASAQHVDVLFSTQNGVVVTGGFDFNNPSSPITPLLRVFPRDLNTVSAVYTSADPGFTTASAANLAPFGLLPFPDGALTLRILAVPTPDEPLGANLLYWNGLESTGNGTIDVADVAFTAVPNAEIFEFRQTGCFTCATLTADGGVDDVLYQDGTASPFVVATQSPGGVIHKHLNLSLVGSGVRPTEGIYLLGLESDGAGAPAGAPYYFVLSAARISNPAFGLASKNAALAWVQTFLATAGHCLDGVDNDGDGRIDLADPGCASSADTSERGTGACDNGLDDDGDGGVDFYPDLDLDGLVDPPGDLGCAGVGSNNERPQCQDGLNNDAQLGTDWDGGVSAGAPADPNGADPQCAKPTTGNEAPPPTSGCGIGPELAALVPLLSLAWRRARRRA